MRQDAKTRKYNTVQQQLLSIILKRPERGATFKIMSVEKLPLSHRKDIAMHQVGLSSESIKWILGLDNYDLNRKLKFIDKKVKEIDEALETLNEK
jgi:hypothetical protein